MSARPQVAARVLILHRRGQWRYFCRWSPTGRLQTAWSLAGARLFLPVDDWDEINKIILRIKGPLIYSTPLVHLEAGAEPVTRAR